MCGLLLLAGENSQSLIEKYTQRLKHRGPDRLTICNEGHVSVGFQRLAINGDTEEGQQPFKEQGWLALINGEIYNFRDLIAQYELPASHCDTAVVLPLYLKIKDNLLDCLEGFYAAVMVNPEKTKAVCLRDAMGKKPLFVGACKDTLFITSELKTLPAADWFKALPKGISTVDLHSGNIERIEEHQPIASEKTLTDALIASVEKRLPRADQPVGVFLSGGLDSSLLASIASRFRADIQYFVLGNDNSDDVRAARAVEKYLELQNVAYIPLPDEKDMPELMSTVVYATESYNPSIISNGISTFLLARAAKSHGIKVVLTGEGADELFGGYHYFTASDSWQTTRSQLIHDMEYTELRRLDLACMANAIEPRCPFLDQQVKAISDGLCYGELYDGDSNKVSLRKRFTEFLPQEILNRRKTSFDVGSGIRGMVMRYLKRHKRTEREALLAIWRSHFNFDSAQGYFHRYPTFDALIDRRGESHR